MTRLRFWVVIGLVMIATLTTAQDFPDLSDEDNALLNEANNKALTASAYAFDLDMSMSNPSGTVQGSGSGAVQRSRSGVFSIGARANGFQFDLDGNANLGGIAGDFDIGLLVLGNDLYMEGISAEGWTQMPLSGVVGGSVAGLLPAGTSSTSFVQVTRQADSAVDGIPAARFVFDYDLSDPAIQQAVTQSTSGLPSFGGAIATGSQAAALVRDGSLRFEQFITLEDQQLRLARIDFRLGDTRLQLDISLHDYGRNSNLQPPANAEMLDPGEMGLGS